MPRVDLPTSDCEIACVGPAGQRVRIFPPVLGTICDRCRARADDVCFLVERPDGTQLSGGLCAACLIPLLEAIVGREA